MAFNVKQKKPGLKACQNCVLTALLDEELSQQKSHIMIEEQIRTLEETREMMKKA